MFGGGSDKGEEGIKARWSKCGFLSKLPMSQCVRTCGPHAAGVFLARASPSFSLTPPSPGTSRRPPQVLW